MKPNLTFLFFLFLTVFFSEPVSGQEIIDYQPQYNTDNHYYLVPCNKEFQETENRSRYRIPRKAYSIDAGDIDLDGDIDIVVGHNFSSMTQWGGVSIVLNDGFGYFELYDSVFLYGWQPDIQVEDLDNESYLEIIAKKEDTEIANQYMAVINDFDLENISYYPLNTNVGFGFKTSGDVNNDGYIDILTASNSAQNWSVLFNNGSGQLMSPLYYNVSGYFPSALACGDLNEDGRDDVVVCGQNTEIYFSYTEGFERLLLEQTDSKTGAFVVDFDFDGDNDLLTFRSVPIANISMLKMYENLGEGLFDTLGYFSFQSYSTSAFIDDFDNDSLPDVLFTLLDNSGLVLFYNQGSFQLGDSVFISLPAYQNEGLRTCTSADFDGNGYNDIAIIRGASLALPDNLVILFNDGAGNFGEDPVVGVPLFQNIYKAYNLSCYPNPFVNETALRFFLKDSEVHVRINIYNLQGKLQKNLVFNSCNLMNNNLTIWNGKNDSGISCRPGVYIASLVVNNTICDQIKVIKHQ